MNSRWNDIPFVYRFVNLNNEEAQVSIPFATGGATQQGVEHVLDNLNNQDALSILIGKDFLAGTVCDGCTSTHDSLRASFSNNEVGAKLIAYAVTNTVQKLISTDNNTDFSSLIQGLSEKLSCKLVSLVSILAGDDEKNREVFIFDFLMTTILGFIVTREHYIVFGCGNGIIGINNQITILEDTGSYFAASLLAVCCPSMYTKTADPNGLKVIASGYTSDLINIFVATDGFNEIAQRFNQTLIEFTNGSTSKSKGGFDFLLFEFRKRILGVDTIAEYSTTSKWPKDDASFLLLRRTDCLTPTPSDVPNQHLVKESQK